MITRKRNLLLCSFLAASAAVLSPAALSAQEADQAEPEPTEVAPVTIEGQRLADQVRDFVGEVAEAPRGRQLARWDGTVCVGAVNMDARYGQFMIDRVMETALSVGIESGEPGCTPDVLIIATGDGDRLARELVDDSPSGFRPARGGTDFGSAALRRFQSSGAPVRWWHVSMPVSVDTGDVAVRLDGEDAPSLRVRGASRLASNVRDDLKRVVIILDVSQIGVIPFGALSDYVAMAALAQIDPEADTSAYPTVLNLFADRAAGVEAPEALTDWDRDYLRGLYTAPEGRARATQQERAIAGEILNGSSSTDPE